MATLALSTSFDGIWPPDALAGGVISLRLGTQMTYVSDAGFTVTLLGTGLTYDEAGNPSGGTVTGFTIVKDSVTFASLSGASVDFARSGMLLLGFDEQNGGHRGPDPYAFIQNSLRGNDLITGSSGWDDLRGGIGNDTINAGAGDDYVVDEGGNDVMNGGDGWDTLTYDEANWRWESFRGVNLDAVSGIAVDCWGFTDHFSNFEMFKDSLYSDTLKGSDADEEFVINRGNDVVDGRSGFDWVNFEESERWGAERGVNVNLATGVVIDPWKGTDTLANVEGLRGTILNDRLIGSGRDETFLGGRGIDTIDGAGGVDRIGFWLVGNNDDGGHGVTVNLTKVKEVVDDGYGNAENADRIEDVDGSRFADRITGNDGRNFLWGDDGNDTLIGGGGGDDLGGGWANDVLLGGLGNDSIGGGGDNDTMTGNAGADQFFFGWDLVDAGVDTITDMQAGLETIWIGSWWGGGLTLQDLAANQFRSGAGVTTANSATQRVIYNTTTGDLYFDADGSGGAAAVKFAIVSNHAALTFSDIQVML
jgi:serralysin